MPSNVLVIEDEPDIRKTIDYNLSKESFKVIQAASIEEGEKALASNKIDVIILDLMLPDGSGLTLCRDIKSEPSTKNIPVIILTAKTEEVDRVVGFELGADEMEFGVGIHGEPGRRRDKIKPAQDITNELLEAIIEDLKPNSNEETLLFVNGMGGTPLTELYLVFDNAKKLLDSKNIKISRSLVGNYCTSLEMQGASITLTKLDEEIAKHWDSKVHTAAMRWGM